MTMVERLARNMRAHDATCPLGEEFDKFGRVTEEKLTRAIAEAAPGSPELRRAVRLMARWKKRRLEWWRTGR